MRFASKKLLAAQTGDAFYESAPAYRIVSFHIVIFGNLFISVLDQDRLAKVANVLA